MKLSVIVPARDARSTLEACLSAVRSELEPDDELIVVDDGSVDETDRIALSAGARVVRRLQSRGPSVARNEGARQARGDTLLFVDADVVVPAGMRRCLAATFASGRSLAAVGLLAPRTPVADLASRYENAYMHWAYRQGPDRVAIFYSSLAAISRPLFETSGGFDESYAVPSVEDMDLGVRLALRGHMPRLLRNLEAVHLKRFGLLGLLRANARKAKATLRLRLRYRGRRAPRSVAAPGTFVAGIPLTATAVLLAVVAPMRPELGAGAVVLTVGSFGLRARFLWWLVRHQDPLTVLAALVLLPANDLAYAVGLLAGAVGWLFGRRL